MVKRSFLDTHHVRTSVVKVLLVMLLLLVLLDTSSASLAL